MQQQVHFRSGIGGDSKITETAYEIINELDRLDGMVKGRSNELEQSLAQLEEYQSQMQQLRQKIIQEEQHLRVVLAPTYLPHDRETAISEQQVSVFGFLSPCVSLTSFDYFRHLRFNTTLQIF